MTTPPIDPSASITAQMDQQIAHVNSLDPAMRQRVRDGATASYLAVMELHASLVRLRAASADLSADDAVRFVGMAALELLSTLRRVGGPPTPRERLEVARPYVMGHDPADRGLQVFLPDGVPAWGVLVQPDQPPAYLSRPGAESGLPEGCLVTGTEVPQWRVDVETGPPTPTRRVLMTRADPFRDWSAPVELVVMAGAS